MDRYARKYHQRVLKEGRTSTNGRNIYINSNKTNPVAIITKPYERNNDYEEHTCDAIKFADDKALTKSSTQIPPIWMCSKRRRTYDLPTNWNKVVILVKNTIVAYGRLKNNPDRIAQHTVRKKHNANWATNNAKYTYERGCAR